MQHVKKICLPFFIAALLLSSSFAQTKEFIKGADISWLQEIEAGGGVFRERGSIKDPFFLLKEHGFNYIRLRIWHTPDNGINGLDSTLIMARRIKKAGLKFLLDFHFSDWWADPGTQTKPKAWNGVPFVVLKDSIHNYVRDVFSALKKQNTLPQMVQFGNEIICGMLWPDGYVCGNTNQSFQWSQFTDLLISADAGMKEVLAPTDSVLKMVHIDRGGDYSGSKWFFDNLNTYTVEYDIIGLSFYPWWHGSLENFKSNISQLEARYKKEIIIAEIAYPFTLQNFDSDKNIVWTSSQLQPDYPATVDGQFAFLSEVLQSVKSVPNNRGRGIFYWEPAAVTSPKWGSAWENLALFGIDGEVLYSIKAFENTPNKIVTHSGTGNISFSLSAYPNPFNPTTTISYQLVEKNYTMLKVYDILGREIALLVNRKQDAGNYSVQFDAKNLSGGMYFYQLQSGNFIDTKKMIFAK